jgi:hypothetical protein
VAAAGVVVGGLAGPLLHDDNAVAARSVIKSFIFIQRLTRLHFPAYKP